MKRLDIHNPFDAPIYHEETVGSTMEGSRCLARNGAPHGAVSAAEFQEAGRGRIRERRWETERGSALAFTVLLRLTHACGTAAGGIPAGLTLRAGLAAALAIEDFAPTLAGKALIKWPNDILLPDPGDRHTLGDSPPFLKTAGILAEAEGSNVHIGIGVNLLQKQFPAFLRDKATSVSLAAAQEYNRDDRFILLEKILSRLRDEIADTKGTAPDWRECVEARLYRKGAQVCFAKGAADSGSLVTGILAGIGPEGELLITPCGEHITLAFTAGELLFSR
jgi:BirA family biotin operon repressor/biotin-[acetyl-CoA-carboxylase] ligase